MDIRLSGPRSLAMATIAVGFGWAISGNNVSEMSHYRGLSHQALLDELTARHTSLATNIVAMVLAVGLVVFGVDLLTRLYEAVWARIASPAAAGSAGSDGTVGNAQPDHDRAAGGPTRP